MYGCYTAAVSNHIRRRCCYSQEISGRKVNGRIRQFLGKLAMDLLNSDSPYLPVRYAIGKRREHLYAGFSGAELKCSELRLSTPWYRISLKRRRVMNQTSK